MKAEAQEKMDPLHTVSSMEQKPSEMTVAFIGNPNCGKTTLFNAYTGANLKVANWPGVTVEKVEGGHRFPRRPHPPGRLAGDVQPDVLYDGRAGFP